MAISTASRRAACITTVVDLQLHNALRLLRISGILGAAIRTADGHYRLWIGDTDEGVRDSGSASPAEAAPWLIAKALQHYPRSDFVKARAFLERMMAQAARSRT
jgi:hypothetical protein